MTDLEMDLMLANAENAMLKDAIAKLRGKKCTFGPGVTIKPDGVIELDPCIYEIEEIHENVTVYVRRCKDCGSVDISWKRQENTVSHRDGEADG